MEAWTTHIANFGFPIVISIYLLTRIEQKMVDLTESIKDLAHAIGDSV